MIRQLTNLLISIVLLSGVFATSARACTCGEVPVAEYLRQAKVVFEGEVISKRKSNAVEKNGVEVTMKVRRVWKGKVSEEIKVHSGATGDLYPFVNLCATPFEMGHRYLVFAHNERGKLATNVCAGTSDFPYAEEVIKQLGQGTPPLKSKAPAIH